MLQPEPIYPLLLDNDGDANPFASRADIDDYVEPQDVLDNHYKGYDLLGRLLDISVENDNVVIRLAETEPSHANELRKGLIDALSSYYFNKCSQIPPETLHDASIEELFRYYLEMPPWW